MQNFIVFAIVAAATFYLVKMLWDAGAGRKSGCNGCGSNCASHAPKAKVHAFPARIGKAFLRMPLDGSTADSAAPLVQIDLHGLNRSSKILPVKRGPLETAMLLSA